MGIERYYDPNSNWFNNAWRVGLGAGWDAWNSITSIFSVPNPYDPRQGLGVIGQDPLESKALFDNFMAKFKWVQYLLLAIIIIIIIVMVKRRL